MAEETPNSEVYDAIIVGAGAAGMVCGFRAAESGKKVLVLEKNRKVGAKILMSGGTRCNVTHNTDRNGIVKAFGKNGRFLHSSLSVFGPEQVVEMFDELGVPTKVEKTGKIFPVSDKSLHVQQALLSRLNESGCELRVQHPVTDIQKTGEGFLVTSQEKQFHTRSVAIASGGKSFPGCGTIGEGYRWVKQFGHTVKATFPALVPLTSEDPWVWDLKGIAIQNSEIAIVRASDYPESGDWQQARNILKKKSLESSSAAILFTHFGLSGPAPMNVSKAVSTHQDNPSNLLAIINLAPNIVMEDWSETLEQWKQEKGQAHVGRAIAKYCQNEIPERLWSQVFLQANVDREKTIAEISKKELQRLIDKIHFLKVSISGTLGFEKAEVTTGGVNLKEVNPKTMESKKCPGLFLIGEVLDLDGWIGGYNFQSAFSTGWVAGSHM